MKMRKLLIPSILFVLLLISHITASCTLFYTTRPEVGVKEFPYSITYEYKNETNTIEGVYVCEFDGSKSFFGENTRYWNGFLKGEDKYETRHIIEETEDIMIYLHPNLSPGYMMGDPIYREYSEGEHIPYVECYDFTEEPEETESRTYEETLEGVGFKVISWDYPEPIENDFSFSGIRYTGDSVGTLSLISFIFIVLCLIFVRKDKEYLSSGTNKATVILNFAVLIVTFPLIFIVSALTDINGDGKDLICQISYITPAFLLMCIGLSIAFRRKCYEKTAFFIQFGGPVLFSLTLLYEWVKMYIFYM